MLSSNQFKWRELKPNTLSKTKYTVFNNIITYHSCDSIRVVSELYIRVIFRVFKYEYFKNKSIHYSIT